MFISSVTAQPEELADLKNVDRRAKLRIGAQLGVDVSKVNRFLHNYEEMLSACYTASFLLSFYLLPQVSVVLSYCSGCREHAIVSATVPQADITTVLFADMHSWLRKRIERALPVPTDPNEYRTMVTAQLRARCVNLLCEHPGCSPICLLIYRPITVLIV